MELKKVHWIGIGFGLLLVLLGAVFFFTQQEKNIFLFFLGLAVTAIAMPFVAEIVLQNKREQEINQMFLEFSRNLAESVATGTPISKSIVNMSKKNYGSLSQYIVKLANQISLGIPLSKALQTFAQDVRNPVISRAVALISEAERAGGEIDSILDSVAKSISEIEKLKSERRAAISSLIVQGYIIFFIFIGIMLVMEFKILPLAIQVNSITGISQGTLGVNSAPSGISQESLADLFLYLLLAQGFFTGFAIGKLAEGSLRSGIKHSFVLTISAVLISTGVRALFT
ncbi:type II secretion system F family protein [Candidatus Pacearchaeota archaeon]|nr:type II secretion system F family protein [Candidatus Pacearchaeota archaeon]